MATGRRSELAKQYVLKTWRDMTAMNVSLGTMLHNRTGSWRAIRPVYEDKIPTCQNACPVGNDIEGWLRLLEQRKYKEAYWHLKREEPFPAILGRVCFKFCENACNRSALDRNIDINDLECFLGDWVSSSEPHPLIRAGNGKTLAVVGSGPAGMSASYFARLLGFNVTIFEKYPSPGGILRVGIPAYRLPREVVDAEFLGLQGMGIELRTNTLIGRDISLRELASRFDYIFLGTGAHRSLPSGLEGDGIGDEVMSGLTLLNRVALGEKVALGRQVVVIGGGNTAIDAARSAIRLGSEVTVVYRRSEAEMPAHPEEVLSAREEGVQFRFLAAPERVIRSETGGIDTLLCCEMALGAPDESGRKQPIKKDGSSFPINAQTIVTAIGEEPDLENFDGLPLNRDRTVDVDNGLSIPFYAGWSARIYAGGDIINIPRTVAHAVASGKRAAIAIDCDRRGEDFPSALEKIKVGQGPALSFSLYMGWDDFNPSPRNNRTVVDSKLIVYDYFQKDPQLEKSVRAKSRRAVSFEPCRLPLSEKDVHFESQRCMHCGRCTHCDNCLIFCPDVSILDKSEGTSGYFIDYEYCKGCGICSTECPRQAITMVSESTDHCEEG
jgi:2-oxoacid:acceptor oxidoreductase delta subunit (pyruvate/2-ketoisovalerate family)